MLTNEAFEALAEACFMNAELAPGERVWRRLSRNEENEPIEPGLRNFPKKDVLLLSSPLKTDRVGDSPGSARCNSFESKNGKLSSKESDLGRGMAPRTVLTSSPWLDR